MTEHANDISAEPTGIRIRRQRILKFLDEPESRSARAVSLALLALIYLSVAQIVIEMRYPGFAEKHLTIFWISEYLVLSAFTVELIVRLLCHPKPLKYLISFYGIIDLLAVVPGWAGILYTFPSETTWVRVFRILRFARVSKTIRSGSILGGILGRMVPFLALAMGLKGVMVALEGEPWWPRIGDLSVIIGVVGFALAILLGTKLRVVNNRLYALEDAVCRIIGSLRDMQQTADVQASIAKWAVRLEQVLLKPDENATSTLRAMTVDLEARLEAAGIGDANTAGFHRDVEYVLHRATAMTPKAYDNFLRNVTIAYTATVIFAVPGLTGFLSSILVTYVLGGMVVIAEDMDSPLEFTRNSYIDANIDPVRHFNEVN